MHYIFTPSAGESNQADVCFYIFVPRHYGLPNMTGISHMPPSINSPSLSVSASRMRYAPAPKISVLIKPKTSLRTLWSNSKYRYYSSDQPGFSAI